MFSGGGAKGAFGVGVLWELRRRLPTLRWHVVSGTSTGALITPLAALADAQTNVLDELRDFYLQARQKDIVDSNFDFWEIPTRLFDFPEGLYNFDPLRKRLEKALPLRRMQELEQSDVVAIVNAVCLQTGELLLCTQDRHRPLLEAWFKERARNATIPPVRIARFHRFRPLMVASSSIPMAVDPVAGTADACGKVQLVDGGVIDIAPLRAAIAAGATHVVAVLMSPLRPPPSCAWRDNLLEVGLRAVDLLTDEVMRNDVEYAELVTSLQALSSRILAEEGSLPPGLAAWASANHALLDRLSTRLPIQAAVVQPPKPLGETLDFDGEVRAGYPENPDDGGKVNVMEARFECGRRTAARLLDEPGSKLREVLAPFA